MYFCDVQGKATQLEPFSEVSIPQGYTAEDLIYRGGDDKNKEDQEALGRDNRRTSRSGSGA